MGGSSQGGGNGATQQQYCLKWNNHQSNLLRVFNRLLGSEQFTDVLIAAEGQTLRAHKVVLSACSSYFEQLFSAFNEKNQIVILKDTKYDDLSAIIEFMYKGEISVVQEQLSSLLKTAENLKVKGLAEVSGDDKTPTTATPKSVDSIVEIAPKTSSSNINGNSPNDLHAIHRHSSPIPAQSSPSPPPPPPPSSAETKGKKRGRPRVIDVKDLPSTKVAENRGGSFSKRKLNSGSPSKKSEHQIHHHPSHHHQRELSPNRDEDGLTEEDLIKSEQLSYMNEDGAPTPGGPLTMERIQSLGVVKMNDYLQSGTRQQFWDEYFIKVVMQGVRNKEIDMKSAAEILGVSYGTLYGRYRETFGYLKHAWNVGGRPPKYGSGSPGSKDLGLVTVWTDPQNEDVLEQLKRGRITIKQAADLLGMEPSLLDYHLTGKAGNESKMYEDVEEEEEDEMMEVQPDIILRPEEIDPIEVEDN